MFDALLGEGGKGMYTRHVPPTHVVYLKEDVLELHVSVDDALSVAEVGADDDVLEEPPARSSVDNQQCGHVEVWTILKDNMLEELPACMKYWTIKRADIVNILEAIPPLYLLPSLCSSPPSVAAHLQRVPLLGNEAPQVLRPTGWKKVEGGGRESLALRIPTA